MAAPPSPARIVPPESPSPVRRAVAKGAWDRLAETHARVQAHYRSLAATYGDQANQTCEVRYHRLVREALRGATRVLELGSGSNPLLDEVGPPGSVACDLTLAMLQQRARVARTGAVVGAGEHLPFRDAAFDGMYSVNAIEHVADVPAVLAEAARVLAPGGVLLLITPNGGWERLLDLAEGLRLKIPEGPHEFLTRAALARHLHPGFEITDHRTFLVLPGGPSAFSQLVDRLTLSRQLGLGFFQYVIARRRANG